MEKDINKMQRLLENINMLLLRFHEGNISDYSIVKRKIAEFTLLRKKMIDSYGVDQLKLHNKKFDFTIKQIISSFDNTIESTKQNSDSVVKQIKQLSNKKKLTKYYR